MHLVCQRHSVAACGERSRCSVVRPAPCFLMRLYSDRNMALAYQWDRGCVENSKGLHEISLTPPGSNSKGSLTPHISRSYYGAISMELVTMPRRSGQC